MDNLKKFPAILQKRIEEKSFRFPDGTKFSYTSFPAFRLIDVTRNDTGLISRDDFRSKAELNQLPRRKEDVNKPQYYGVSLSVEYKYLKNNFKLPKPKYKVAKGIVYQEGGPCHIDCDDPHVCWWLYEEADVSSFSIVSVDE